MKLDFGCPHCKKDITLDSEKMKIIDTAKEAETVTASSAGNQQTITKTVEPEVKEIVIEKVKTPAHIPSFKCKDGKCGKMHPNDNYTSKITGKCSNCGQFTSNIKDPCPFCNKNEYEELDEDELKDLGIPEPKEIEHDHESQ